MKSCVSIVKFLKSFVWILVLTMLVSSCRTMKCKRFDEVDFKVQIQSNKTEFFGKVDSKFSIDSIKQREMEMGSNSFVNIASKRIIYAEGLVKKQSNHIRPIVIAKRNVQESDSTQVESEKHRSNRLKIFTISSILISLYTWISPFMAIFLGIPFIILFRKMILETKGESKRARMARKAARISIVITSIGMAVWTSLLFIFMTVSFGE